MRSKSVTRQVTITMKFPIQIRSIFKGPKVVEIEFLAFQNITSKGCNFLESEKLHESNNKELRLQREEMCKRR